MVAGSVWHRPHGWSGLVVLVVAFGLSGLSDRYVEEPFRRNRGLAMVPWRGLVLYPAAVAVTLPMVAVSGPVVHSVSDTSGPPITTAHYGQSPGDPEPRFGTDAQAALVQASVLAAHNGYRIPGSLAPSPLGLPASIPDLGDCDYGGEVPTEKLCARRPGGDKTLVLIGDSHARQWIPAVERLAEEHGYRAYYLVREGCAGADVTPWMQDGTGPVLTCEAFQDWARRQVVELQPDLTMLASDVAESGLLGANGERVGARAALAALLRQGMVDEIEQVRRHSGRVVVIGDPPNNQRHPDRCLSQRGATLVACMSSPGRRSLAVIGAVRSAAEDTGTGYIDVRPWFCWHDECPLVVGSTITLRDRNT